MKLETNGMKDVCLLSWWLPAPVDQTRNETRAETVIDIYYRNIRSARVQHSQQRCSAAERRAIPDAGRHRDYRHADESTYYRRQRAFHSRRNDHDTRTLQQ